MAFKTHYLRVQKYVQRHGLKASIKRLWQEARNKVRYNREVIYWRDLHLGGFEGHAIPENCRIERFDQKTGLPERLIRRIAEEYSEELLQEYVHRRLAKGASLWCLRNDTEDMTYTWILSGHTMKPHYFPVMEHDIHFFDGYTFPQFRGRGLNPVLLNYVLRYYRDEGFHRAYLETKEWNIPVQKMVPKNGFVKIAMARKRFRRGKGRVTWWYEGTGAA